MGADRRKIGNGLIELELTSGDRGHTGRLRVVGDIRGDYRLSEDCTCANMLPMEDLRSSAGPCTIAYVDAPNQKLSRTARTGGY